MRTRATAEGLHVNIPLSVCIRLCVRKVACIRSTIEPNKSFFSESPEKQDISTHVSLFMLISCGSKMMTHLSQLSMPVMHTATECPHLQMFPDVIPMFSQAHINSCITNQRAHFISKIISQWYQGLTLQIQPPHTNRRLYSHTAEDFVVHFFDTHCSCCLYLLAEYLT